MSHAEGAIHRTEVIPCGHDLVADVDVSVFLQDRYGHIVFTDACYITDGVVCHCDTLIEAHRFQTGHLKDIILNLSYMSDLVGVGQVLHIFQFRIH